MRLFKEVKEIAELNNKVGLLVNNASENIRDKKEILEWNTAMLVEMKKEEIENLVAVDDLYYCDQKEDHFGWCIFRD